MCIQAFDAAQIRQPTQYAVIYEESRSRDGTGLNRYVNYSNHQYSKLICNRYLKEFPVSNLQKLPPPRDGKRYQALGYLRVSHDLQADNHTFETQLEAIKKRLDDLYGADN